MKAKQANDIPAAGSGAAQADLLAQPWTEAWGSARAQSARALWRHYLFNRKVLIALALAIAGVGLALSWNWLVAAGIAPILLAIAPCAAMCALGVCMSRMGGKSCSSGKEGAQAGASDKAAK